MTVTNPQDALDENPANLDEVTPPAPEVTPPAPEVTPPAPEEKAPEAPAAKDSTAEAGPQEQQAADIFSAMPHIQTIWFDAAGGWRFYETPGTVAVERPNKIISITDL
jgi:hypothetical protein